MPRRDTAHEATLRQRLYLLLHGKVILPFRYPTLRAILTFAERVLQLLNTVWRDRFPAVH